MNFKVWLEEVIVTFDGASGSGKTTLVNDLNKKYKDQLIAKDLDEFDEEAVEKLGYADIRKNDFTNDMLKKLADKRQELMDQWIDKQRKPIVLGGHHWEDKYVLDIPTKNKFLLNTSPEISAYRAYKRSQKEEKKYRRLKSELPEDIKQAKEDIEFLKKQKYITKSAKEIEKFILNSIK